jgi:hypothetical protein
VATFDSMRRESWLHGAARKLYGKTALSLYVLVAVVAFGDTVLSILGTILHLIGALLHYVVEVLELLLEHALESAFGLSGHKAQMATAWIGLAIFSVLAVFLLRWAVRAVRKYSVALKQYLSRLETELKDPRADGYLPKSIAYACLALAVFYLFFL